MVVGKRRLLTDGLNRSASKSKFLSVTNSVMCVYSETLMNTSLPLGRQGSLDVRRRNLRMTYDHRIKAGNQGDVVKHVDLLAAVRHAIDVAPSTLLYADAYAGPTGSLLLPGGGWSSGIGKLNRSAEPRSVDVGRWIRLDNGFLCRRACRAQAQRDNPSRFAFYRARQTNPLVARDYGESDYSLSHMRQTFARWSPDRW